MNRNSITRRIGGAVLAAALSLSGLAVLGGFEPRDAPDQTEEVAGATWSRIVPIDGDKDGPPPSTLGATWS